MTWIISLQLQDTQPRQNKFTGNSVIWSEFYFKIHHTPAEYRTYKGVMFVNDGADWKYYAELWSGGGHLLNIEIK